MPSGDWFSLHDNRRHVIVLAVALRETSSRFKEGLNNGGGFPAAMLMNDFEGAGGAKESPGTRSLFAEPVRDQTEDVPRRQLERPRTGNHRVFVQTEWNTSTGEFTCFSRTAYEIRLVAGARIDDGPI